MLRHWFVVSLLAFGLTVGLCSDSVKAADEAPIKILFLGDNGHHRPAERAAQLVPVFAKRGIEVQYTDDVGVLKLETLNKFDGLMIFANIGEISPEQEAALLNYVASGKGLIPLHCATYCFLNSPKYIELVGGQFQRHGFEVFRTRIDEPSHPIMKGYSGFESIDESYVHHKHNERDRIVLERRVDNERAEPYTWVRTHGKGRVFYTAWGHDERTWGHPGFQNLVERGTRWAVGRDLKEVPEYHDPRGWDLTATTPPRKDVAEFEYVEVGKKIPNYLKSNQWGTQGEALSQMQKPASPDESQKHYQTLAGFEVELFVSEKDLAGKPIAMNWDERGRLWLCETFDYPNELQPRGKGRDKIQVCEDTDGDGKADKVTTFAEQLSIPTSIIFARGGVIVQDGTETVFLKDTNGDDKADERTVLISGWGMGDTHGGVSNFQYGLDNWIWGMQGYNDSAPVVNGQKQQSFRMGFFRFRPDATELEFVRSTNNNTWGLGISEEGVVFGSTANHNPSVYMPIANRYYERVRGWGPEVLGTIANSFLFHAVTDKVRQVDQFGGYTAGAGHSLYTARHYPKQFWNRTAFVCEPTGHLVGTFLLNDTGADYKSSSPVNLIASDDEWSAPIMAEVGPDGNVWVLDWYNYIVQHNPTPAGFKTGKGNAYETDLRDKKYGRIYRVVYKGSAKTPAVAQDPSTPAKTPADAPKTVGKRRIPVAGVQQKGAADVAPGAGAAGPRRTLAGATPQQLVAALRDTNAFWRKHAQRLLIERGQTDVVPALTALVKDASVDEIGLNPGAIHALWTLQGLKALDGKNPAPLAAAREALRHRSAGVRRNAIQVLPATGETLAALTQAKSLEDDTAQVRLAALLALADQPPSKDAGALVAPILSQKVITEDRWLADAATSAAAIQASFVLPALGADGAPELSEKALAIVTRASEHWARSKPADEEVNGVALGFAKMNPRVADAVLAGVIRGWPRDHAVELSPEAEKSVVELLGRLPANSKGSLIRLATAWGSKELEQYSSKVVEDLLATASARDAEEAARIAAVRELIAFRPADVEVAGKVLDLVTAQAAPSVATGVIDALGGSTAESLGTTLVEKAATLTPAVRGVAMRVLLLRPESVASLLDGIEARTLQLGDLKLDQKQALAAHPNKALADRAKKLLEAGGGLPSPDRVKVLEELLPVATRGGDAKVGKEVFKKNCAKCHQHSGEGEKIGPDLTGMAVHPKEEMLTNVIDPNRSVEGNFRVYTVALKDGRTMSGLLAGESKTTLELFDSEGKKHSLLREDVDELIASTKSLMPEGFEKQITPADMANLLEFLAQRGKFLPLDLRKGATVVSTRGMFFNPEGLVERMVFDDWTPKTFEGVPFQLVDPQEDKVPNVILLNGPEGIVAPKMPKSVTLACNAPARAIHLLSGASGWGFPIGEKGSVSMIVRLHYADGQKEDHPLKNGEHFADYIRRVDVPGSKFAFDLRGRQIRYLAVIPQRGEIIKSIEFVKGTDRSAPIVMSATVETRDME